MKTVLTDYEIDCVLQHYGMVGNAVARAIEAAVLAKFGEPVAWKVSKTVGIGYGDAFIALDDDTNLYALKETK